MPNYGDLWGGGKIKIKVGWGGASEVLPLRKGWVAENVLAMLKERGGGAQNVLG